MQEMLAVEDALREIAARIRPLDRVEIPIAEALGCVLSSDVHAPEPAPAFTNASMDGYAIRCEDAREAPVVLRVIEDISAGFFPSQKLKPGTAARIMTGAPLPAGADAVVPVEATEKLPQSEVRILSPADKNQFIRFQGEEIQKGDLILEKGRTLQPADIGLLASLGKMAVEVIPKPNVILITTGSEVVDPFMKPEPGQIRDANRYALTAHLGSLGYPVAASHHVNDDPERLKVCLQGCWSDVIVSCGGVSAGEYDFVRPVLAEMGEIYFWKVAIKPGKPFVFGRIGRSWFFGLPGNPVSARVAFDVLVKPALLALAGQPWSSPPLRDAILAGPIEHQPGRTEYVRAKIYKGVEGWIAKPLPWQGSAMLRSLTEADAWIVVPRESQGCASGSRVQVLFQTEA